MINYIIDKSIHIKGDIIIKGLFKNVLSDYDNNRLYNIKKTKPLSELIGYIDIYEGNIELNSHLIYINYGNNIYDFIVDGNIIMYNV